MSTIINGSSPSITFSDSTTQASAGLPLTGGTLTGTTTFTGGIANANGFGVGTAVPYAYPHCNIIPFVSVVYPFPAP